MWCCRDNMTITAVWSLFIMFSNQNSNCFKNICMNCQDFCRIMGHIVYKTSRFVQMRQTWKRTFSNFTPTKSHHSAGDTVPLTVHCNFLLFRDNRLGSEIIICYRTLSGILLVFIILWEFLIDLDLDCNLRLSGTVAYNIRTVFSFIWILQCLCIYYQVPQRNKYGLNFFTVLAGFVRTRFSNCGNTRSIASKNVVY